MSSEQLKPEDILFSAQEMAALYRHAKGEIPAPTIEANLGIDFERVIIQYASLCMIALQDEDVASLIFDHRKKNDVRINMDYVHDYGNIKRPAIHLVQAEGGKPQLHLVMEGYTSEKHSDELATNREKLLAAAGVSHPSEQNEWNLSESIIMHESIIGNEHIYRVSRLFEPKDLLHPDILLTFVKGLGSLMSNLRDNINTKKFGIREEAKVKSIVTAFTQANNILAPVLTPLTQGRR